MNRREAIPRRSRSRALSGAFAICALVAGCGLNIFPVSKDVQLGKQIDTQIRRGPKDYPILAGHDDVRAYVRQVAATILQSPEIKYKGTFPYTIEVIRDDKTVNAFCTPGGYIYVYTGLLKFVENEATLAGVLAHEIAHAELRHATQHMTQAYGMQMALDIALGQNPTETEKLLGNLFAGEGLLIHSRGEEAQADEYSFRYLRATPYYPAAIKFFFEKILRTHQSGGGAGKTVERLLSDHPLSEDRLDAITKMAADAHIGPPSERSLRMIPYRAFQSRLP